MNSTSSEPVVTVKTKAMLNLSIPDSSCASTESISDGSYANTESILDRASLHT